MKSGPVWIDKRKAVTLFMRIDNVERQTAANASFVLSSEEAAQYARDLEQRDYLLRNQDRDRDQSLIVEATEYNSSLKGDKNGRYYSERRHHF